MELNAAVIITVTLGWVFELRLDKEPCFFLAFADGGGLGRFARLDFAAGKFPEAGERDARRALADQEPPFMLDDGDRDGGGHFQPGGFN